MKRVAVAAVLVPLLFLYVMKLPAVYFVALLSAVSAAAQSEFYSMCKIGSALRYASVALGTLIIISSYLRSSLTAAVVPASVLLIAGLRLFLRREPASALRDVSVAIMGMLYIPLLLSQQMGLRLMGPVWIIFLYGAVWASDSTAYYTGKTFGKRKLYPEMSPNKTVEGAVGSVLGGVAGAFALWAAFSINMKPFAVLASGAAIGAVSVVGDLVESMFKRDAGVKDSSGLIPGGHGGMLDKIDAVLFAGPMLYWVLRALGVFGPSRLPDIWTR